MNRPGIIALGLATLFIAALLGHLSAQSTTTPSNRTARDRFERLVKSLSKSGQSNTLSEVVGCISAAQAEQNLADLSVTMMVLEQLRSGRTNQALQYLETRLDGDVVRLGAKPQDAREAGARGILEMTKRYRSKYPHKGASPEADAEVDRAFNSLLK